MPLPPPMLLLSLSMLLLQREVIELLELKRQVQVKQVRCDTLRWRPLSCPLPGCLRCNRR